MMAIQISVPKLYKEQDELLLGYISKLSEELESEERTEFIQLENDVLSASNNQIDLFLGEEFKSLVSCLSATPSVELFDIMALNCYTCLADAIPENLEPFSFIDHEMEPAILEAYLRFVNNFFGQKQGMCDAKKNMKCYIEYFSAEYPKSRQSVLRALFALSRVITVKDVVAAKPIELLLECLGDIEHITRGEKLFKVCTNLAFGALGRILMTAKKHDTIVYNKYCQLVKNHLPSFESVEVPCLKEVIELTGWKKPSAEDELY